TRGGDTAPLDLCSFSLFVVFLRALCVFAVQLSGSNHAAPVRLPAARAPAAAGRFQARLRPPTLRQRRVAARLRARERAAVHAPGPVGVAEVRRRGAAQPAAAAVPRGVPADAGGAGDRRGPGADPAPTGGADARGAHEHPAEAGTAAGEAAGAGRSTLMIGKLLWAGSLGTKCVLLGGVCFS